MKIGVIARRHPITAPYNISIKETASIMTKKRIGLLVLVKEVRLFGVVSERDIIRAVAQGISPEEPASLIATRGVVTIEADEDVIKAAKLMREHGVRHLVVTKGGELYGVVSVRDIVNEVLQLKQAVEGGALDEIVPIRRQRRGL